MTEKNQSFNKTNFFKRIGVKASDPSVLGMIGMFLILGLMIYTVGEYLMPFFVALILAYLLESPVSKLTDAGIGRTKAVSIVYLAFVGVIGFTSFLVIPMVIGQVIDLGQAIPGMAKSTKDWIMHLAVKYPDLVRQDMVLGFVDTLKNKGAEGINQLVYASAESVKVLMTCALYGVLVSVMLFFMLKDKDTLLSIFKSIVPEERELLSRVWKETDAQIGYYIRGRVIEIIIVSMVTYLAFFMLNLNYAIIMAMIVGFSVLIPYVGAAIAGIPVMLVAMFQFGISEDMLYVLIAYAVIQGLDGNVLAPILLAGAVNLNPVMIIVAILIFGGLFGLIGVFFSIPVATMIKSVFNSLRDEPLQKREQQKEREGELID